MRYYHDILENKHVLEEREYSDYSTENLRRFFKLFFHKYLKQRHNNEKMDKEVAIRIHARFGRITEMI